MVCGRSLALRTEAPGVPAARRRFCRRTSCRDLNASSTGGNVGSVEMADNCARFLPLSPSAESSAAAVGGAGLALWHRMGRPVSLGRPAVVDNCNRPLPTSATAGPAAAGSAVAGSAAAGLALWGRCLMPSFKETAAATAFNEAIPRDAGLGLSCVSLLLFTAPPLLPSCEDWRDLGLSPPAAPLASGGATSSLAFGDEFRRDILAGCGGTN